MIHSTVVGYRARISLGLSAILFLLRAGGTQQIGVNGDAVAEDLAGGLSLVRSAVDLVLAYADPDDRSSEWLLRLLWVRCGP